MMSQRRFQHQHQEHTASRTRAILRQGLFSDVDISVHGQIFHCHRYVLAQHFQFFFSELVNTARNTTATATTTSAGISTVTSAATSDDPPQLSITSSVSIRSHKFDDDDDDRDGHALVSERRHDLPLSPEGECLTIAHNEGEGDSHRLHQERLLESLGRPVETKKLVPLKSGVYYQSLESSEAPSCGRDSVKHSSKLASSSGVVGPASDEISSKDSKSIPSSLQQHQSELSSSKTEEPQRLTLKLNFLSPTTFGRVLEAIYCDQDVVTSANALDIHKAASRLQISGLLQHCEQYIVQLLLQRQLDASEILHHPQMADSSVILQGALEVLLTDFEPGSSRAEWFLKLSAEKLFSVLTDPRLNVRHEDEVYQALMDWYGHDPPSRHVHMGRALSLLRLANLSKRILVDDILPHPQCCADPAVQSSVLSLQAAAGTGLGDGDVMVVTRGQSGGNDVTLAKLVRQALAYHLLPDRRHDEMLSIAEFRPSQDWERVLVVLGDQSSQLYAFSPARRAWYRLCPPPRALGLGVAGCTHGEDLYLTGGDKATTGCYRYRAEVNQWRQLGELQVGRRSHGCVAVRDNLYVIGGKDDRQSFKKDTLDSVETLQLRVKGQGWRVMTSGSLVVPVRSMACAVHHDNIYVFGGRTNGLQQTVDAVQCVDTRTQQCSLVAHLPSPTCLARPFIAATRIHLLDPTGHVLRFHPNNIPHHQDGKAATPKAATTITAFSSASSSFSSSSSSLSLSGHHLHGSSSSSSSATSSQHPRSQTKDSGPQQSPFLPQPDGNQQQKEKEKEEQVDQEPQSLRGCHNGLTQNRATGSDASYRAAATATAATATATAAEHQVFSTAGRVRQVDWKWFGVGRGHEGTLYVVAGEWPPGFQPGPASSSPTSPGGSTQSSSLSSGSGGGKGDTDVDVDVDAAFRQVRFIRPEKMEMCYVSCHLCIPKSFLVEKIVE